MAALAVALGRALRFSVVTPRGMVARVDGRDVPVTDEPPWAAELRKESGMLGEDGKPPPAIARATENEEDEP